MTFRFDALRAPGLSGKAGQAPLAVANESIIAHQNLNRSVPFWLIQGIIVTDQRKVIASRPQGGLAYCQLLADQREAIAPASYTNLPEIGQALQPTNGRCLPVAYCQLPPTNGRRLPVATVSILHSKIPK